MSVNPFGHGLFADFYNVNDPARAALLVEQRVERTIREGGVHVGIWIADVEHVGPFMGVAPSGARFDVRGITAYELRDDRIVAHWEQFDVPAILGALGLMARP